MNEAPHPSFIMSINSRAHGTTIHFGHGCCSIGNNSAILLYGVKIQHIQLAKLVVEEVVQVHSSSVVGTLFKWQCTRLKRVLGAITTPFRLEILK